MSLFPDNTIYMNRITPKLNRASAVDFADFDIEEPERLSS
jgi:hypothetical protein